MKIHKFTAPLLMTSILAGMIVLTSDSYGMERLLKQQAEQRQREAALQAQVHAGGHVVVNIQKHRDALKDPAAALAGPAAAGNLTQAIDDAVLVAHSAAAAHAGHVGTVAEKIAALEAIDGASAAGTDDVANSAVRTALGLDPSVPNFPVTKPDVIAFINAAKQRLVTLPDKTAKATGRKLETAALKDPAHALDDAQTLGVAIQAARADGANSRVGAGPAYANNDYAGKLAALTALADNNSGAWGGAHVPGANDVAVHLPAVVAALGLGSLPDAQKKTAIDNFVTAAHERLVRLPDKTLKATGRKQEAAGRTLEAAALKDPTHALDNAQPLGVALLAARADALVAGGNSRAPAGAPFANNDYAGKLAALTALADNNSGTWGGAHAPGANDVAVHLPAVVAALGLGTLPDAQKKTAIDDFVAAAHERLVTLPAHGVEIANKTIYINALTNPAGALAAAGAGTLRAVLAAAVGDPGSAANGLAINNTNRRIIALQAIEGGGAADNGHKSALRTALGIDPNPVNFGATNADVQNFIIAAKEHLIIIPGIDNLLGVIPGGGDTRARVQSVLNRLRAASHQAGPGGPGGPGAGGGAGHAIPHPRPPAANIQAALNDLGL